MALCTIATLRYQQLLLLVILFVVLVHSQTDLPDDDTTTPFNATLVCTMVQNGTFIKDPTACNTWIQCVDYMPISGTCANDLFYDRNTNECVDQSLIKCYSSDPCATITINGFVADPYSCNGYYYCYNGKGSLGSCSTGMIYNSGTEDCIRESTCVLQTDPDSWCNIIPDGEFFTDLQSCQGYHFCDNGLLETGACPNGYYFNAFENVCDYKANVSCSLSEPHPIVSGNGICQTSGQFVSDNETCSGYYLCQVTSTGDFLLIWGQCSNGRFFDSVNDGECVDRQQIACVYNRCEGMGSTSIQLANAANDGCLGYLICQNGDEIGNGTCPTNEKYYDEVKQLCTATAVSYLACLVTVTSTTTTTTTTSVPINLRETTTTLGSSSAIEESSASES